MTFDELIDEWTKDSKIDRNDLDNESIKIDQLQAKYWKIRALEHKQLRKMEADMARLKLMVKQFVTHGVQKKSDIPEGWVLPPQGRVSVKADIDDYVNTNCDVIKGMLKLHEQKEKIELLESIEENLFKRGFNIHNAIKWIMHRDGVGGR